MDLPIFLLVGENPSVVAALARDLARRYATDFDIRTATGAGRARDELAALARRGVTVALVIAHHDLAEVPAVEFLAQVRAHHPAAKRVLVVDRGDWSARHPAVTAMELGHIDFHLFRPWWPLDQILYPSVAGYLQSWARTQEPAFVAYRIVGERWSPRGHELRDLLARISVPYRFLEHDSAAGRALLDEVGVPDGPLPVLVGFNGKVLVDPSHAELASDLGMRNDPEDGYDVAVLGAGPAGLAAAVYAASEGLRTLVLEPVIPGGQAGTSSMIRNYLGFHLGISGDDLANRALEQAWLFGAHLVVSRRATGLAADGPDRIVTLSGGRTVTARAVVIATGVAWRRLGVPALEDLVGAGVFYGAASAEARAMQGQDVYVVGAGNSAGQAALHLARYAASVTMLVRGASLAASMSEYLIKVLEETPNVRIRLRTAVVDGAGRCGHLDRLTLHDLDHDRTETVPASALFLLIGGEAHTDWLAGAVARDVRGFLLTGHDLTGHDPTGHDRTGHDLAPAAGWPLDRPPMLLETSLPGVFAAGDVRHRSIKRVASAVGEGATAIQLVHQYFDS